MSNKHVMVNLISSSCCITTAAASQDEVPLLEEMATNRRTRREEIILPISQIRGGHQGGRLSSPPRYGHPVAFPFEMLLSKED